MTKKILQQCHIDTNTISIIHTMPMFKAKSDLNSEAQNSGSSPLTLNTRLQE